MVEGAVVCAEKDPGFFAALRMTQKKGRNLDSREKNARCMRTLTFTLSLAGRGDRIYCKSGGVTLVSQAR
jgi:hypothetical protein